MIPDVRSGDIWAGKQSGGRKVIYRVVTVSGDNAHCLAGRRRKHQPTVVVPLHGFKRLELVRRDP